ncbi:MAG TPA: hypothetical protein VMO26_13040 [Vicinamibacterales bacterium]|nr:hypothetical protein [Vicinamibacterales bacterium]
MESLVASSGGSHWSLWQHVPSILCVWQEYSDTPYHQHSPMGGALFDAQAGGTFLRRLDGGNQAPQGLSALDLYAMGAMEPNEVPDTLLLRDATPLGGERYRATGVPLRVADIIAVEGDRIPSSRESQRTFALGVYLIHEPGRSAYPEMVERTTGIANAVVRYFEFATGGRMRLTIGAGPGAPSLTAVQISANPVTLSWVPGCGSTLSRYTLVAGTTSGGSDVALIPVGTQTALTGHAPLGTPLFVRIVAGNSLGIGVSNEVRFVVGGAAPSAPTLVASQTAVNPITLQWSPGTHGGAPTGYTLSAGTAPGASNLGVFPMGPATSITAPAPLGVAVFARITATNAAGSATSNEVTFTVAPSAVPATPGLQPPVIAGASVTLTWSPGAAGEFYVLRARPTFEGPVIAEFSLDTPFATFPHVPSGHYLVTVLASNGVATSAETSPIVVVVPDAPPKLHAGGRSRREDVKAR